MTKVDAKCQHKVELATFLPKFSTLWMKFISCESWDRKQGTCDAGVATVVNSTCGMLKEAGPKPTIGILRWWATARPTSLKNKSTIATSKLLSSSVVINSAVKAAHRNIIASSGVICPTLVLVLLPVWVRHSASWAHFLVFLQGLLADTPWQNKHILQKFTLQLLISPYLCWRESGARRPLQWAMDFPPYGKALSTTAHSTT